MIGYHIPFDALQGVPFESHPSKLAGSKGSKNRYFDFDKLAEVWSLFKSPIKEFGLICFS